MYIKKRVQRYVELFVVISAFTLLSLSPVFAQPEQGPEQGLVTKNNGPSAGYGQESWAARYGGTGTGYGFESAEDIALDKLGNVYVTGKSLEKHLIPGTDPPEYTENYDYVTIKYYSNGDVADGWPVTYNGTGREDDAALALTVDDEGNAYVTGISWNGVNNDYVTIKYTPNGSVASGNWPVIYNGTGNGNDKATDIAVDANGNVFVTGTCDQDIEGDALGRDYTTIKYDAAGGQEWVAIFDGIISSTSNGSDFANAIAVDSSGDIYVTGEGCGAASEGTDSAGDYVTIKYNTGGGVEWTARYHGGSGPDKARDIVVDGISTPGEKYVYITGLSYGAGEPDYATVKYDASDGTELWVARYNSIAGYPANEAFAVGVDHSGNVYVTGVSIEFNSEDYLTIKYDSSGIRRWIVGYDGPHGGADWGLGMAVAPDGNVYVTGMSGGDYATVGYDTDGNPLWDFGEREDGTTEVAVRYNGYGLGDDEAKAIVLGGCSSIYVTGMSWGGSSQYDLATVKYSQYSVSYPPEQPMNQSPASGAEEQSATPTLKASPFLDQDPGDIHVQSQWQIAVNSVFSAPILDEGSNTALTSYTVSPGILQLDTWYWWRVRYQDCSGTWSDWDDPGYFPTVFKTIATNTSPEQPENVSPEDGAAGLSLTPTLEASDYIDSNGDPHWQSQWQIADNSVFSAPILNEVTGPLTAYIVPSDTLDPGAAYWWRGRYQDSLGGWSDWDDPAYSATSFTTNFAPDQPMNINPSDGAINQPLTVTLKSSIYTEQDGDTHAASQWQIAIDSNFLASALVLDDESGTQLTSYTAPSDTLNPDTTYWWRVRYQDSFGIWSDWDDVTIYSATSFTTFGKPMLWPPVGYDGGSGDDKADAVALYESGGNTYAYVTGKSWNGTDYDCVTIKYAPDGSVSPGWPVSFNGTGAGDDLPADITVDSAGNAYVTGKSWGGDPTGTGTDFDYVTIKYPASGVAEDWAAIYSGGSENGYDQANAVAVDASGNVYVTGMSWQGADGHDCVTVKYDSAGNELWAKPYHGGHGWDWGNALAVDVAGNTYVTGGSLEGGPGVDQNYITLEYDPDGNLLVSVSYNGTGGGYDETSSIALDSSTGDVYVTGLSAGIGTGFDYATIKYNSSLIQQEVSRYNGPGDWWDEALAITLDSLANVYVTGKSWGDGTDFDYATIKYDSSLVQQWVRRYNGPGNGGDEAYAIASGVDKLLNEEFVVLTGASYGSDANYDYATLIYTLDGENLWRGRYDGTGNGDDKAYDLAVDSIGNVYVTGESWGGDPTDIPPGTGYDYATVAYDPPVDFNPVEPALAIATDKPSYITGDTMDVSLEIKAGTEPTDADLYIRLKLPNGTYHYCTTPACSPFSKTLTPVLSSWSVTNFGPAVFFSYTFGGGEPPEGYAWQAVLTEPGTYNVIGDLSSAPFAFSP